VLITDPAFYAVAVPAVLLVGISKSGFGSGFGALGVPLMSLAVPVPQAVAVMLPLLLVMDAFGLKALWGARDRALLRLLVPAGLLGTAVGALLFKALSAPTVAALVGAITLVFLAIRKLSPPRADAVPPQRLLGFGLAGLSGFTSFVAHAGGPPIGFFMLPLRLAPLQFTATMAVFFAAINAAKWLPYAWLGLIDATNMATAAVLLPAAPLGVWLGLRIGRWISPARFYVMVELGLLLTGCKLLWDGLRPWWH
jgi:uncharacterized membrane protein YfcA